MHEIKERIMKSDQQEYPFSRDALRLLFLVSLYTGCNARPWLKDFNISIIVHLCVRAGLFENYDLAPSIIDFRGIKMFALVSQEAVRDSEVLFRNKLIERIILNTRYYASMTATRISDKGMDLIQKLKILSEDELKKLDKILKCPKCGKLMDFAVGRKDYPSVHLIITKACNCYSKGSHLENDLWFKAGHMEEFIIEDFFSIGSVEYKCKPYFFGGSHNG